MDNSSISSFKPKGKKISLEERDFLRSKEFKWCPKCSTAKSLDSFSKSNTADGLNGTCKDCVNLYRNKNRKKLNNRAKEYYQENREEKIKWAAEYREKNSEKVKESKKEYYNKNKDKILAKYKEWREDNLESCKLRDREYHRKHRARRNNYNKKYRKENLEKHAKLWKERYHNDQEFHIWQVCRQLVRRAYQSIGTTKERTTREFLGYSAQDLKEHIEKQFEEDMSWDNYGEWHIDHIIPISNAATLEEGLQLSQLENLQPLWAEDNIRKSNKLNF